MKMGAGVKTHRVHTEIFFFLKNSLFLIFWLLSLPSLFEHFYLVYYFSLSFLPIPVQSHRANKGQPQKLK
jgi:hypothetical protein